MGTKAEKKTCQQPEIFDLKKHGRSFRVSRRDFLRVTGSCVAAATLSSCLAAPETEVIPTSAKAPTSTPSPVPTQTRTRTPTPTKIPVTASTRNQGVRLRQGAGTETMVIGVLAINVQVLVIGKLADASWLQISVNLTDLPALKDAPIAKQSSSVVGWMRADLLEILTGSLDDVPVVETPSTPTPLPNEKPTGEEGITYKYTDLYGNTYTYTLPCGAPIPAGAICTCNCVSLCSCVGYVAPPTCKKHGSNCTCHPIVYWYPN